MSGRSSLDAYSWTLSPEVSEAAALSSGQKVVLGPLGLVALGAGLEIMRRDFVVGLVCSVPGALIFAFLAFCFALHVRAQRLWGWHVQTGRTPRSAATALERGGGGGCGRRWLGGGVCVTWAEADGRPLYGSFANYAFYGAFLYGLPAVVVLGVVAGWAKRGWDRTAIQ